MIVDEGDPFSVLLVNKSINEIKARNIFGKVEHKMQPGSSDDLRVLEISVEEKSTGEIMAGAGIGTDGTSFMFSVNENNWMGKGIRVESSLHISEEKVLGSLKLNDPNYNFSGNQVHAGFNISDTDRSETSGFESSKTDFQLGTSFEQYENVYFSPEINVVFEDIEVDASASTAIKNMEGNFLNVDFKYGLTLDKRDMSFRPTEGYKTTFIQSLPLLQDSSAIMNGLNVDVYHDFSEDIIGSLKFYARTINGIDEDVRLTKRLYMPRKRLRGFDVFSVGPKDGNDYIGGNYTTALSAEAQLPNLLPESYRTDFSVFLDTGNVWAVDYDNSIDETNKIRSSIGLGANVFTPIGPLSFILAQDLTKSTNDKTQTFNFQLGTSF
jgi:outer membrane protein insertion porin family